jgi:electron transport complex protein RnfE
MQFVKEIRKGFFKENPIFVLILGLCPTLAVTSSVKNGFFMGVAASAVLICSNALISIARKGFPNAIRIPCFIIVIASFVTMVDLLMNAFAPPPVVQALGIFIPLIVVNCIIMGRAEAFAAKNNPLNSIADGIGIGCGYMMSLMAIALIREVLGSGSFWNRQLIPFFSADGVIKPAAVMGLAPGAFLLLGMMFAFLRWRAARKERNEQQSLIAATPAPEVGPEKKKKEE